MFCLLIVTKFNTRCLPIYNRFSYSLFAQNQLGTQHSNFCISKFLKHLSCIWVSIVKLEKQGCDILNQQLDILKSRKMLFMFHKVGFPWFKLWNNLEESTKENMSQIVYIEWSFVNWWLPDFWLIKIGYCNLKQSFKINKLPFLFIIIF